jgi:hypothetical protein
MNERIEKLAIECYQAPEFDYKKFAELIVKECVEACEKNSYLALNGWQRANQIREHFGVE